MDYNTFFFFLCLMQIFPLPSSLVQVERLCQAWQLREAWKSRMVASLASSLPKETLHFQDCSGLSSLPLSNSRHQTYLCHSRHRGEGPTIRNEIVFVQETLLNLVVL